MKPEELEFIVSWMHEKGGFHPCKMSEDNWRIKKPCAICNKPLGCTEKVVFCDHPLDQIEAEKARAGEFCTRVETGFHLSHLQAHRSLDDDWNPGPSEFKRN